jgi:hypothetical protein
MYARDGKSKSLARIFNGEEQKGEGGRMKDERGTNPGHSFHPSSFRLHPLLYLC